MVRAKIILNLLAGATLVLSLCSFTDPPTTESPAKKKKNKEPVELPDMSREGFSVSGGSLIRQHSTKTVVSNDTISQDSITSDADTLNSGGFEETIKGDSVVIKNDTLVLLTGNFEVAEPDTVKQDSTMLGLSYMALISAAVPTFGQFYNRDYWKIPVFLAAIGTPLYFGIQQNKIYRNFKNEYEGLLAADAPRTDIDPVQRKMILHNTWQQLLFGGAVAAYVYTLYDAVTNYGVKTERIRMATTLSFVCPGLGQLYNGSYWKLPLFVGGFATFGYMIDWNNRGYVRFDRELRLHPEGSGYYDASALKSMRNAYRRNRDLCIIITGVWYLLNVLDAHVDAQLKDYDISDDLSQRFTIEPIVTPMYTLLGRPSMSYSIGLNFRF